MAEGPKARGSLYSIVVLGPMNPRLHHPAWYNLIGAISQEEANEAVSHQNIVCVQPFSAFQAAGISIACQENRWEVSTKEHSSRKRLFDIVKMVFTKLFETPIMHFGINTNLDLETSIPDVAASLSALLAGLDVGFPVDSSGDQDCWLHYKSSRADGSTTVHVQPLALDKSLVYIAYNTDYVTARLLKEKRDYFDIAELLAPRFDADLEFAMQNAQTIVGRLTEKFGG